MEIRFLAVLSEVEGTLREIKFNYVKAHPCI
jgi:hypothetical protein